MIKHCMVGETCNHYFGLREFKEIGFLLHFLRQDELFIDIVTNVGSCTVLAAAVGQARWWLSSRLRPLFFRCLTKPTLMLWDILCGRFISALVLLKVVYIFLLS
jgi:hypothetical protein